MITDPSREAIAAQSPIGALKGVGPARERALRAAGLETLLDLLLVLPVRYEDRRLVSDLVDVSAEGVYTLTGKLDRVSTVRVGRRRMTLVRATLTAGSEVLPVAWFNRPYLAASLSPDEEYLLHGKVRVRGEGFELVNPSVEARSRATLGARVVAIYPKTGELGPALVRRLAQAAVDAVDWDRFDETVPVELLKRRSLPGLAQSLRELHRPSEDSDVEQLNGRQTPAHARLVYGELLRHQTELAIARRSVRAREKQRRYSVLSEVRIRVAAELPFRLTDSQDKVLDEILRDLESPAPMMRLLQGDVGSGKTVVAGIAMAGVAQSGYQAALLAPTELLAEQHHRSLCALLGDRHRIDLLTASTGEAQIRDDLRNGRIELVVGTHALMQEAVSFQRLGLAVVDEQHRFGVAQRRSLVEKGELPDLLVMTATPIPRSLALTAYGDLSLSIIDELPPGRRPVDTRVVSCESRQEIYDWLMGELRLGHKAFIVLPLIEESERVAAEAVEGLGGELAEFLAAWHPLVLHGRMDAESRSEVMRTFASGSTGVLIATTLVEVGVDVPEATTMIIESAERFGLAQLHQLRGRVGRSHRRSTCVAIHGKLSDEARRRLETFRLTRDGFELAEADLEIRGPGDVLGTRQSGVPELRLTDLARHREWIERARRDARALVRDRPATGEAFLTKLEARAERWLYLVGA